MRSRLKWLLPMLQVLIALFLTTSNFLRPDSMGDPSWMAPDRQFCDALNAPAAVVRFCIFHLAAKFWTYQSWITFMLENLIYFALIALLWYGVSREITGRNDTGLSSLTHKSGANIWLDLLLVCFGVAVGFFGERVRHQFVYVSLYSNLIATPYILLGMSLVMFYGHDLWVSGRVSLSRISDPRA